ncbi:MAG TPA: aldo/keto reductase [Alphaproteobacteria bacterium]|nr:aldo/keto reductase [Alphaproteobacteria bacterium]
MRMVTLPAGEKVAALGQGTWELEKSPRADAIKALRLGLDLAMTLVDTAEMYGEGKVEEIVGEAIAGRREEVFLVSKAYPWHATKTGLADACARSLKRLKTDRIDLYLLHWRGDVPLAETVEGMEALRRKGAIRHWGVSNLDRDDMEELIRLTGGGQVQTNQVLYNLAKRGIEFELLPWCRKRRLPIMAYSPFDKGPLLRKKALAEVALRHAVSPATVALAWILRQPEMIVIPKSAKLDHVRQNEAALKVRLTERDLADLDAAFPAPEGPGDLEMN